MRTPFRGNVGIAASPHRGIAQHRSISITFASGAAFRSESSDPLHVEGLA